MAARTIEARLVISGEDRASQAIANVVKTVRQLEDAAKVSKPLQDVAKSLMQVEQAEKAVSAAMSARSGFAAAEAGLKATQGAAHSAAQALNEARVARAAFDGVKAVKGSEQAKQIEAATKAVRDAGAAYRKVEGDVRRATAAIAAQLSTLQHAEAAASKLGADLGGLEAHQQHLRVATEGATSALRAQIRIEDQAARAAQHHAREQAEAARHMRQHGAIGLATTAAAGYVSAHGVVHGTVDAVKAGARLQHEVVALKNAGRTSEDLVQIERASRATVKAVPTATFEENLKVVNETVSAFGSLDHALEHLTFMQKASAAVHAAAGAKITDSAGEMGNKMARFAEERGSAGDGHRFERETEGLVRAMVFSGGNFNPHEAINFAQQAKSSLRGYNEEFLTSYMPSIVGTMKGERAGTAANAFNNVINGKVNDKKQAEEWMRYGLLDEKQAIMKGGHAVAWRTGAVKDTTLAHQNPLEWMEKVVLPALKAKGVNVDDDEALSKVFSTMFRGNTSNFFANEVGLKSFRDRLHKDAALQKQTGSLNDIYNRNLKEDPTEGVKAVKSGLEDVLAAATSPLMAPAAVALKGLAEGLQSIALAAKDHPMLAAGAGGAAVAGGLAASGYASYKLMTGFGLPSAAAELTVAGKMLQGAAVEKGAVPAAAAAAFGLGGITIAGGAVGGAYLDSSEATQSGMGVAAITGGETAGQRLIRENHEMQERQKTLAGQAEELTQRLETERGVYGRLKEAYGTEKGNPAEKQQADAAARIRRWEEEVLTLDAKIKALGEIPIPPPRPPDFTDFKVKAGEAGTEAGTKAGEGIRAGIETKAPEVEQQGRTLYERIKELFGQGINLPINFAPGEGMGSGGGAGGGLIQKASFGGSDGLGAMVRRSSLGGSGGGGGNSDGGGGETALSSLGLGGRGGSTGGTTADSVGSGSDYTASIGGKTYRSAYGAGGRERVGSWLDFYQRPIDQGGLGMVPDKARAMVAMMQGESGINLNPGAMGDYRGRTPTAFGSGQWRLERAANLRATAAKMGLHWTDVRAQQAHMRAEMLGEYGPRGSYRGVYDAIQAAPSGDAALAIGIDRYENPAKKALAYRFRHPYLQALRRDKNRPTVPVDEPKLVKGLDGKEGLDLGNGTMKMPDGSIRSIPSKSGLTIPDPPAGGFGGGGGRGDMRAAAERMHQAADRMEGMGFHGQIQLAVTGSGRDSVRATGMRTRGRGGMSADMGISMPGAKESDGDWV